MENSVHFDHIITQLRAFFKGRGFIEVPSFSRLSILAACEDPSTVTTYSMGGQLWPCPQTGQMWLEIELLKNPNIKGAFCLGPSYRNEPNPIPGRHRRVFPMMDFEARGSIEDCWKLEQDLLVHLGFEKPKRVFYEDACEQYGVNILEAEQEERMMHDIGTSITLERFPHRSNPYFVMKRRPDGLYNKIDVLLYGMETIGSSERSTDVNEMRELFYTTSDSKFSNLLFNLFGKQRVLKELDEYFSLPMVPRFGGGIGITRLESAMKAAGLFEKPEAFYPAWKEAPFASL